MKLPISVRWDQSIKLHLVVTTTKLEIWKGDKMEPHSRQVECVMYDVQIPYPQARLVMEMVDDAVCSNPAGVKLRDSVGMLLNVETGELRPERND